MNRELKFRAWDGKKMRTAFDLSQNPKYWWEENKDFPLMQFTGLHDKNGKEIYEGDIVCFAEWSRGEMCWKGSIHFDYCLYFVRGGKNKECDTTFEIQLSRIPSERIEVIGNIFDNPELLKEVSHEA